MLSCGHRQPRIHESFCVCHRHRLSFKHLSEFLFPRGAVLCSIYGVHHRNCPPLKGYFAFCFFGSRIRRKRCSRRCPIPLSQQHMPSACHGGSRDLICAGSIIKPPRFAASSCHFNIQGNMRLPGINLNPRHRNGMLMLITLRLLFISTFPDLSVA